MEQGALSSTGSFGSLLLEIVAYDQFMCLSRSELPILLAELSNLM